METNIMSDLAKKTLILIVSMVVAAGGSSIMTVSLIKQEIGFLTDTVNRVSANQHSHMNNPEYHAALRSEVLLLQQAQMTKDIWDKERAAATDKDFGKIEAKLERIERKLEALNRG